MGEMGHGWVTPRKDGYLARCGGPSICPYCQAEKAELERRELWAALQTANSTHQGADAVILAKAAELAQPRVLPGRVRVLRAVVFEGSAEAVAEQIARSLPEGVKPIEGKDLTIKVVSGPLEMQLPDGTWEKVP